MSSLDVFTLSNISQDPPEAHDQVSGIEFTAYLNALPFDAATTTLCFLVPRPVRKDVLQAATVASNKFGIVLLEFDRASLVPDYVSTYRAKTLQYVLYHRWLASFPSLQAFFRNYFFVSPIRFEPFETPSEVWMIGKNATNEANFEWLWGDIDGANSALKTSKVDPFTLLPTFSQTSSSSSSEPSLLFVWGGNGRDQLDRVGHRGNIEECFSSYMMDLVSNSTMLRAGLVLSSGPVMLDYLELFSRILVGNSDLGQSVPVCEALHAGVEQGVHNVIFHLGLIKAPRAVNYLYGFPLASQEDAPIPPTSAPSLAPVDVVKKSVLAWQEEKNSPSTPK